MTSQMVKAIDGKKSKAEFGDTHWSRLLGHWGS